MTFDELHVVSDLHFGGEGPNRQIFASTVELEALIDLIAGGDPTRAIAFAINGDFIDFLAERPSSYFDPAGAVTKLERVMSDPAFAPIFAALTRLLATRNRTLIVNLGNHDLELALPWVRERLIRTLCGENDTARARLVLVADGTGVLCNVGKASVLLLHGNEVDSWNVADFERIRRVARDLNFGKSVVPWTPNAGTKMVIDVMNGIKEKYPFVDLLKPESEAVVPTLLALDPGAIDKLRAVVAIAGRRAFDAARMVTGFLGDTEDVAAVSFAPSAMGQDSLSATQAFNSEQEDALMSRIEAEMKSGSQPRDLLNAQADTQLGVWSATWNLLRGRPKHEILRVALDNLDADRSFELNVEDSTFKQLDKLVAPEIDFVIAGHTHLERALERKIGRGVYFNTGTWARLIRLTPEMRQDPGKFQRVFGVFEGGTMTSLDQEPGLVTKRCSLASVYKDGARVLGELRRVHTDSAGTVAMTAVEKSSFVRG